jgi:hypothetical protein
MTQFGHNPPVEVVIQFEWQRRSLTRLNVRNSASNLMPALPQPGHNPPVGVAFQFPLVGRLAIELNGRYSASKLMTALAQTGPECVKT